MKDAHGICHLQALEDHQQRLHTNLPFPGNWKFIGAAAPANIAANKVGTLELWCDGTAETDVMARWTVQP